MINPILTALRDPRFFAVKQAAFVLRGLAFAGRRFQCPCCGWRLRGFVAASGLVRSNPDGYCPRCNAKARHRRHALYLDQRLAAIPDRPVRIIEVAPWWALSRKLRRMEKVEHVGVDLVRTGPQVNVLGNAAGLPLADESFDAAICTHVLEHVVEDRRALSELHRVLKPGGWAMVSVPIRLDQPTHEDPSITDPEDRERLFGERDHVRYYGQDFADRLAEAGFTTTLDRAEDVAPDVRRRFGLRLDEHLFHCVKSVP